MASASLTIRILTFSVCLFCTHTADLNCDDIVPIIKRHGDQRNWYYSDPTQYKNRNCDRCYVDRDGEDCQLKGDGSESCPRLIQIDSTPSESENWICPRHCYSMPEIPYQVKVSKTTSTYKCDSVFACGTEFKDITPRFFNVEMPNAFKIADASSYTYAESADPNTYGVRPISLCKTKRYEDNFNVRVVSCWRWNFRSNKPDMTHLDTFWTSGDKNIHKLYGGSTGINQNEQTISKCSGIDNVYPYKFQTEPCWIESIPEPQQKKQFWIRPHYTFYRSSQSISDKTDCRMLLLGADFVNGMRWDNIGMSYLLKPGDHLRQYNINNHWQNPPTRSDHYYNVQSVFDGMTKRFGNFWETEPKTITKWDYSIVCKDKYNRQQRSPKTYYAESGCNSVACADFISKPCYDNIYRYDAMVCTLIQNVFQDGPMPFSRFKDKIISETAKYSTPFMSYGLHDGSSYFDIGYDTAKVQVKRDQTILDPSIPHVFADSHMISIDLIRDASMAYSCDTCFDKDRPLYGRSVLTDAMDNDIIACRPCLAYEKVQVTIRNKNYQDCEQCDKHQIRNPAKANECLKCKDDNLLTPMRRRKTATTGDSVCTQCQHFQYFDGNSETGCIFLQTVTDNIRVVNKKAVLSGKDFYITGENLRQFDQKFWRDDILPGSNWSTPLVPVACLPTYVKPTTNVPRLQFTAWCGHHEIVRHQQAWVQVDGSTLYVPLNSDLNRTRINTSVVELCGNNTLTQLQGNTAFDLACGAYKFSIRRSGFQDPCTLCLGAKYTDKCWPTYVPGLELYDDVYFNPTNYALTPHPGTCADCNARCDDSLEADSYIDPIPYSCWWNGTGRVPGVLGATATNFSWYKRAPCTKCTSVKLTADLAKLVLACGNRVSYRRWIDDTVTSSQDATRSVPDTKICCVEAASPVSGTLCTEIPAEFQTFSQLKCRQTVDDAPPAFLPYCPPGWYVEPTCAAVSPLWNPDCCVKCKACIGGLFKLDTYKVCPGDEFFDAQDRGCTTKCLTNQYLRNDRCIKCEACE